MADGTGTAAVRRVPLTRGDGNGRQPYSCNTGHYQLFGNFPGLGASQASSQRLLLSRTESLTLFLPLPPLPLNYRTLYAGAPYPQMLPKYAHAHAQAYPPQPPYVFVTVTPPPLGAAPVSSSLRRLSTRRRTKPPAKIKIRTKSHSRAAFHLHRNHSRALNPPTSVPDPPHAPLQPSRHHLHPLVRLVPHVERCSTNHRARGGGGAADAPGLAAAEWRGRVGRLVHYKTQIGLLYLGSQPDRRRIFTRFTKDLHPVLVKVTHEADHILAQEPGD
ncbi:hypothetical protein B0H17DRAFT_1135884 [Mycena rosella]|uniref:Uncharacterized protein n=1 Tax=Mycena rosella TaxID=1033263 RepID=A0AAD7DCE3_MYCRO|nr:hypothetical protein B0H17DRAFT_1141921 [Mycena rosella]KAJ7688045.1 hypothetical protein B0H17DRAFT_1135884 [Mycena rosella]